MRYQLRNTTCCGWNRARAPYVVVRGVVVRGNQPMCGTSGRRPGRGASERGARGGDPALAFGSRTRDPWDPAHPCDRTGSRAGRPRRTRRPSRRALVLPPTQRRTRPAGNPSPVGPVSALTHAEEHSPSGRRRSAVVVPSRRDPGRRDARGRSRGPARADPDPTLAAAPHRTAGGAIGRPRGGDRGIAAPRHLSSTSSHRERSQGAVQGSSPSRGCGGERLSVATGRRSGVNACLSGPGTEPMLLAPGHPPAIRR